MKKLIFLTMLFFFCFFSCANFQSLSTLNKASDVAVAKFIKWVITETKAYDAKDNRPHSIIIYMGKEQNPQALAEFYAKAFYRQTGDSEVIRLMCGRQAYRAKYPK